MTSTIRITGIDKTFANLTDLQRNQIPFATSLALNNTFLDFQKAERLHFSQVFTERRKDFIEKQGVKRIGPPATKRTLSITAGVDPKADFLNKFEPGGARPHRGASIMIPEDIKRNKNDIITNANRPRSLLSNKKKSGAGGVFLLTAQQGKLSPGLYQRTGRAGRGGLKLLFARTTHATVPASLQFESTFLKTVNDRWAINFDAAMKQATATAR